MSARYATCSFPGPAVITLLDDASIEQARTTLVESGHSRAPVVHSGDLDDVVGVVHLRDLLADHRNVGAAARPALQLPDSLRVSDALQRSLGQRGPNLTKVAASDFLLTCGAVKRNRYGFAECDGCHRHR